MNASPAAIQNLAPTITENVINGNIDFWIKLISVFSTAFAVFIAFTTIIFAVLTVSHFKQRERAENELEKLTKIREKSEGLYNSIQNLSIQAEQQNQKISKKLKGAKLDKKKIKKIAEESEALGKILNSLATVSSLTPGDVITSARQNYADRLMKKVLRSRSQPRNDVEAALEAVKRETEDKV